MRQFSRLVSVDFWKLMLLWLGCSTEFCYFQITGTFPWFQCTFVYHLYNVVSDFVDFIYMYIYCLREDEIPSHQLYIVYPIPSVIRNEIFNYKNTVEKMNTNDTRTYGTVIISCNCTNTKYLNHHHGRIGTGDLQIKKLVWL